MNALENLKQRIDYIDLPKQAQRAVDLTLEACEKSQQTYVDRCKELAAQVVHYQDRINELLGEGYKVIQERDELQAEVERLKSDESVPACVWAEDQEGNWDTKCGDKHYLTAGTPFENSMHWCCYCGGSLLEELYGEQAND